MMYVTSALCHTPEASRALMHMQTPLKSVFPLLKQRLYNTLGQTEWRDSEQVFVHIMHVKSQQWLRNLNKHFLKASIL